MSEFMGKNGFIWFVGVVEDRTDPKHLGRLRVRCIGYHTEDLTKLPTADLPWAHLMNPITSATVSGLGQTPLGSVEGTWVIGFFQDGADAQMPVIIGTLPGIPNSLPDTESKKGFQDSVNGVYPKYKETDVNRLAVGDDENPHATLTLRQADRDLAVGTAQVDGVTAGVAQIPIDNDTALGGKWDEPTTPYDATYPYNHVYESEGGHIREMDDTPTKERIHERHSSGTGYEINPDGSKVTRVKKDNYDLITGDHYVHIKGDQSSTTDGGVRVFVNADASYSSHYTIEVGNNANVNIQVNKGDVNVVASDGAINLKSGTDINLEAAQAIRLRANKLEAEITQTWTERVQGTNTKTGSTINLN